MRILSPPMTLIISTLATGLALPGSSAVTAGTVKIEQSAGRAVTVIAEGATISEVVGKLGETYGFRLDHKGAKAADAARDEQLGVDGRYEGSLRTVLDRLLAKETYFIEHAARSKSGIARVVLYNAGPSPTTASAPTPTRIVPVVPRPASEPTPVAAVARYPQAAPLTPTIVPPIRRVQAPKPPAVPVRPTAAVPGPLQTPGQTPGQAPGQTVGQTATVGAAPRPTVPEARKRGGIIQ
jgi:hypothetical protein